MKLLSTCLLLLLSRCQGFVSHSGIRHIDCSFVKAKADAAVVDEIPHQQLKRKATTPTKWIACASTQELTKALEFSITQDDVVAELGAQLRNASLAICDHAKQAVLVDVTRKVPHQVEQKSRAMRRPGDEAHIPSHASFVEIDCLQDWTRALFSPPSCGYTVFVLDVNAICGNDLYMTSISIIQEFLALNDLINGGDNACRLVVIKSSSLHRWSSQLIHVRRWNTTTTIQNNRTPEPHIICCVGVDEYRQTIQDVVHSGDAVLEVGCHLGTTTAILHNKAASQQDGYCIGVDVGSSIVKKATKRHENVYFAVGDAWKTAALLRIQKDYLDGENATSRIGFDVVYVDVGGLSGSDGLLEALMLLSSLSNALEPRCIVIKSLCMQRLASTLVPFWQAQKEIAEK